jgi:hypothetical protein
MAKPAAARAKAPVRRFAVLERRDLSTAAAAAGVVVVTDDDDEGCFDPDSGGPGVMGVLTRPMLDLAMAPRSQSRPPK